MRTFVLFMGAICFVVPALLLVADALPPKKSTSNSPSSSVNAEPNADASPSVDTTPVLTLQNQWDSEACNPGLTLSAEGLIAAYTGNNTGFRSVFAKKAIPNRESGIFYFEVKISPRTDENGEIVQPLTSGYVHIGFATKEMPLKKAVGLYEGAYAYESTGSVTGLRLHKPFGANDIVGCGINLKDRIVFYTKNGEHFATTKLSDNVTVDQLFPCVSLHNTGSKIEANFKLNGFKFDIKNGFRK
uniref:B30.2/SPRY domain-containing protein n=1 Tax=Globodera rostochiensis TaxID=31243 RepID=A0A914H7Y3_GLORO